MPDVLMIFGSKSDSVFYDALAKEVRKLGVSFELRVCSAHRTPKELADLVSNTDAKVIVAGAGLSAALPGVIASQTLKPVIGVPLEGNYAGLDALLSVHQMPPGIPVLGMGVGKTSETINAIKFCLMKLSEIVFIFDESNKNALEKAAKAEALLKEFGILSKRKILGELNEKSIGINIFDLQTQKPALSDKTFIINVPLAENNPENALKLLSKSTEGFFVGLGRSDNAALFALSVLGGKEKELLEYRKKMSQKVIDDDKTESARIKLI